MSEVLAQLKKSGGGGGASVAKGTCVVWSVYGIKASNSGCNIVSYTSGVAFKPNPNYYAEHPAFILNGDISSVTFNYGYSGSSGILCGVKNGTITKIGTATSSSKTILNNSSYDYIVGMMKEASTDANNATITVND